MAKISTLNGHKMAKNGPNDLNFGPGVYFNGFYQIPKKIENAPKLAKFAPKTAIFSRFSRRFFQTTIFHGKFIEIHPSAQIGLLFGIQVP